MPAVLGGGDPREGQDSRLGRGIGGAVLGRRFPGRYRRDVDDGSRAARNHVREHAAHDVKCAVQIDVQAAQPGVGRHLGDRLDPAPPCIVDEGVDPAALFDDGAGDGANRIEVGHIERHRQELPAVLVGQLAGERAATAFMGVRNHHVVAVGGKPARNRRADAGAGRRGDQRHPALCVMFVLRRHLACLSQS